MVKALCCKPEGRGWGRAIAQAANWKTEKIENNVKIVLRGTHYEESMRTELAQSRVQWWNLMSAY
jgi:hypothetical protein